MSTIELIIVLQDIHRCLVISQNATIEELFEQICEKLLQSQDPNDIQLNFTGTAIEYHNRKADGSKSTIADFHIENRSTLYVVMQLPGGFVDIYIGITALLGLLVLVVAFVLRKLSAFRNSATQTGLRYTTDPNYTKKISLLDSDETELAIMPCGHGIGREEMTVYCRNLLKTPGAYRFICPSSDADKCKREWDWFDVRSVAKLTEEERSLFEHRFAENYLNIIAAGVGKCPGCGVYCRRKIKTDVRIECVLCSKQKCKLYTFCWFCHGEWIGNTNCGNTNCDGRDGRIRILEKCPMKTMWGKTFPSQRACTKCGILIKHKDKCGHMVCTYCQNPFCFCCLKGQTAKDKWICQYNENCKLEPRQTSFPESG